MLVKRDEQDKEFKEWSEKQEQERQEKEDANEEFVPDEREWTDIASPAYLSKKQQYVVCLNTMGQDREFTDVELKFALRTVRTYRDRWEQLEKELLSEDINRRLDCAKEDKDYKEHHEQTDLNEIEKDVEDGLAPKEGEEAFTEEEKETQRKRNRFQVWSKMFHCP